MNNCREPCPEQLEEEALEALYGLTELPRRFMFACLYKIAQMTGLMVRIEIIPMGKNKAKINIHIVGKPK